MAVEGTGSAGTRDTRVDRPDEGLPGLATVENPTANPPTRASIDAQSTAGGRVAQQDAYFDTSGTSGLQPGDELKRTKPAAF